MQAKKYGCMGSSKVPLFTGFLGVYPVKERNARRDFIAIEEEGKYEMEKSLSLEVYKFTLRCLFSC